MLRGAPFCFCSWGSVRDAEEKRKERESESERRREAYFLSVGLLHSWRTADPWRAIESRPLDAN